MLAFCRSLLCWSGCFAVSLFWLSAQTIPNQLNATMEPAVPADPLELVMGDAQAVSDAAGRATVINSLSKAHALSNVRAYPYDLKTTFTAFGSTSSDGSWQLEDTSPGGGLYRWTAQGPNYAAVNLYQNQLLYSNQPATAIPVRLSQVRTAIFFVRPVIGPRATLRTATASLNGAGLSCVLLSHMGAAKGATGGRHWAESEYCVDNSSGALITYSPVPGLYALYDYSQALHFHDRLIPNKMTITEAGHTMVEAQTISISDPASNPELFQSNGLTEMGAGSLLTAPWNFHTFRQSPLVSAGSAQIVTLHGMQSPAGTISDIELLASSNSALNSAALETAAQWQSHPMTNDVEAGATPQSHEILMNFTFVSNTQH